MPKSSRKTRSVVTINDVAALAGVSPMTVSRVVNAEKNVRPAKREAVLAAVRQLNYAPNLAARSLAKAEETKIGVIYNNPSAAYLSEFLVGMLDETAGKGAQLVLVKCEAVDEPAERKAVALLLAASVTGVVLPPPLSESDVVRDILKAAGVATVAVATGKARGDLSCVRVDDNRAAFEMTQRLLELGHRRIGFITGHPNQTASAERLQGFRQAMAGAPDAQSQVVQGYFSFASGLTAAEELLDGPLPLTAIFASNDDMAAAAVSVAHRRGLDVPRDLTVVGFDDTAVATTLWPPLTTVRQPVSAMAAAAIDLLLTEIRARKDGAPPRPVDRVTPHTLIERQSSGPAPRA
ncbi:MAG: LacI family DNA-binding transcriptional regulator [Phenylobacterium sp.]|nr:MAG: LacI family DNA-binding transcriptional regulator [Phenylobacterium sp.]